MSTRNLSFEEIIDEKPTLDELCKHVPISNKWMEFGNLLKLDTRNLLVIQKSQGDSTYKTAKMFELWLETNPLATRRQVIETLKNENMAEITLAREYEERILKGKTMF